MGNIHESLVIANFHWQSEPLLLYGYNNNRDVDKAYLQKLAVMNQFISSNSWINIIAN